jgi:hypothetical protein
LMGWARYRNHEGRECGYAVAATCDHPGCTAEIDRGLGYLCGTTDAIDGSGPGCGKYFCEKHLPAVRRLKTGEYAALCVTCKDDPQDDDYFEPWD